MALSVRFPAASVVCLAGALGAAAAAPPASATAVPSSPRAGLVLGGARAVGLDLCWLRAELRRQQGYTLELPALYRVITALDPHNPRAWEFHAEVLLSNLPLAAAGDPDGGWRYARQGLDLLVAGRRANPDAEGLAFALALNLMRLVGDERPADWRARARDAYGIDPLEWALRLGREFHARPQHEGRTDALLAIVCDRLALETSGDAAARWRAEAERLRTHLQQAHAMERDPTGDPRFHHDHDH